MSEGSIAEMRSHVEFRSNKFPAYEGEEAQINPGLWGKRLVEYLQPALREKGIKAGEFYAEDWGWAMPIENAAFPMWIGCGHQYEREDSFLIFIEPSKRQIRTGLFKKVDTRGDVEHVAAALDSILKQDNDIREVRWTEASDRA